MITCTWNDLLNNSQQPGGMTPQQIQQVEQNLTGNRFIYGLSTPINVVDILDRVGVFAAIYALDSLNGTIGLMQSAGIAMVDAWITSIWNFYRPTDQSLTNLMFYTNQLLSGQSPSTINRNACGDVVSVASGITSTFVLQQATAMQNVIDAFITFKNSTSTLGTMQVAENNPAFPTLVGPNGGPPTPIFSPQFIPLPTVLPGYVQHPILEPNPQTGVPTLTTNLLIAEDQSFQSYVTNHPGSANPFVTIRNNPNFISSVVPDDGQTALQFLGQAGVLQAQAVAQGTSLLSSISQLVDQAVKHYAIDQREQILDIQTELLQVYGLAVPIESLNDYANNGSVYAAQVLAAGNERKAALFLDAAFWQSFDLDQDGQLSMQERYNAQVGLQNQFYRACSDQALLTYQTITAELNTLINLNSNIGGILRPFLL